MLFDSIVHSRASRTNGRKQEKLHNQKKPVYTTRAFMIILNPWDYIIPHQDFYLGTNGVQTHFQIRMRIYQSGL